MSDPVLFEELPCENGMRLGVATLNAPQTLNSLSLAMCEQLAARLQTWAQDPAVAVVVLAGAGGKAFCAGGDLHGLYRSMRENAAREPLANDYAQSFFATEYRLDYDIHAYPKPVLCWGHGIVMGGGIGLMAGASHRVVSETSRLAMPEISIGLFPDVGGSWLLNRLPGRSGLFLALTGAQLNAGDALFAGLADYQIASADWPALLAELQAQPWTGNGDYTVAARGTNDGLLERALRARAPAEEAVPGPLRQHLMLINALCSGNDLAQICEEIATLRGHADPWLAKAADTLAAGAPGSARLAFALQQRARLMSLAEVFRLEYWAALMCASQGDFAEGIRALLIDKDRKPSWRPATLAQADEQWVQPFLQPPWGLDGGPLAGLENGKRAVG
ncbi:enoyl-CoA hydratase/isomerase family protein [Orrella sp. JC864]|uniref:enoyl-CoA hydratase/isomerase family protein n=1 Tax=Orrella sp. JC864 TaxID=3120298 RepID=UPI0030096E82